MQVQALSKERDALKRGSQKLTSATDLLKTKDDIITQVGNSSNSAPGNDTTGMCLCMTDFGSNTHTVNDYFVIRTLKECSSKRCASNEDTGTDRRRHLLCILGDGGR
jgi:hypothetical protein